MTITRIKNPRSMRFCDICRKLIMDEQIKIRVDEENAGRSCVTYVHPKCFAKAEQVRP